MVAVHNLGDCLWLWARKRTGFYDISVVSVCFGVGGEEERAGGTWFIETFGESPKRIDNIGEIWIIRRRTKWFLRIFELYEKPTDHLKSK